MRSMVFAKLWPMDTNAPRLTPNLKVSPVFHGKSITNQDKGKGQKGTLNALLTTLITPAARACSVEGIFVDNLFAYLVSGTQINYETYGHNEELDDPTKVPFNPAV